MTDIEQIGLNFFTGLFQHLGLNVGIKPVGLREHQVIYLLTGEADELQGDLLHSLNKLGTQVLNQAKDRGEIQTTHVSLSCLLDIEGKLSQKEALLSTIANDIAEVISHTGRRAVVEGLSAAERRVVHQQLGTDARVSTKSEGNGDFRYLIVSMKR
jgi:predicted RNA-binding protein Jag